MSETAKRNTQEITADLAAGKLELHEVNIKTRSMIEILDKETGREERKVLEDGVLVEHVVVQEGS